MSTSKPTKSPRSNRPSKSDKENQYTQISCKFRGKYDLSKNTKNNEISLENAVNLFEVIKNKYQNVYKNTIVKMNSKKKLFSFSDQKALSKIHHHVPYDQVKKFFVLHKDPTMVIMGVHHKTQRLFLVFQFSNTEDMQKFCDEIEGDNKKHDADEIVENPVVDEVFSMSLEVPKLRTKGENNDAIERISIHSKVYNDNLMVDNIDFSDSFYQPDLEPSTFTLESSTPAEPFFGSRSSSRSSDHDLDDEKLHCDNMGQCKVNDLFIDQDNDNYNEYQDWNEEFICLEIDDDNFKYPHSNKKGSAYIYCARRKIDNLPYGDIEYSDSEDEDDSKNHFRHHEPKMFEPGKEINNFYNHEPKMIKPAGSDFDNFYHHDPKFNDNSEDFNNFSNHKPKQINGRIEADNFQNHAPKLI